MNERNSIETTDKTKLTEQTKIRLDKITEIESHFYQKILTRRFVRNDLVKRKIKSCRKSSKKCLEFKKKLGFDPDERDIISALQVAFEG